MGKAKNHWASVTSTLAKKTGLSFFQAKKLYDVIKQSKGDLTVAQAKRLSKRQITAYKGVVTKQEKRKLEQLRARVKEKERRIKKARKTLFSPLPRSTKPRWGSFKFIKPAPKAEKPPKPKAVEIEYRRPKNQFERFCKEVNAPFLNAGAIAKVIAKQWRMPEWQKRMATIISQAWKSIQRNGYVNDKVRKALKVALDAIKDDIARIEADPSDFWYGILKQLYA